MELAALSVVGQDEREERAEGRDIAIEDLIELCDDLLERKTKFIWLPREYEEMFATIAATRDSFEGIDDTQFAAMKTWFAPLVRHVLKVLKATMHTVLLFIEQQDKWFFRPLILQREAQRTDNLLHDAMGVVANALQGVAPSPLTCLPAGPARNFWITQLDPRAELFEVDVGSFQRAIADELDPDGGWTAQQREEYLEVLVEELDREKAAMISCYDFSEFVAARGLRDSCRRLWLRFILTFGTRKKEALRNAAKERRLDQDKAMGEQERLIEWMLAEGFDERCAGVLMKNHLALGDLWRLRDADMKNMGLTSMGVRRRLLAAGRRLRAMYLKPCVGGFTEWLESQDLGQYAEIFARHHVDFDVLNELTHETLREMDIAFGDRVRILRAIESLSAIPKAEADEHFPLAGIASLFGRMEQAYSGGETQRQSALLARQSLAEFVTGENTVPGVEADLTLAERKLLVARDALAFVVSVADGANRARLQKALSHIARDYKSFQDDLVVDISTVLDAMRTDITSENKDLMARPAPFASRSVRRALLTPQVNPGSRYRCGKSN